MEEDKEDYIIKPWSINFSYFAYGTHTRPQTEVIIEMAMITITSERLKIFVYR